MLLMILGGKSRPYVVRSRPYFRYAPSLSFVLPDASHSYWKALVYFLPRPCLSLNMYCIVSNYAEGAARARNHGCYRRCKDSRRKGQGWFAVFSLLLTGASLAKLSKVSLTFMFCFLSLSHTLFAGMLREGRRKPRA
jgi:hypothetical protein